PVSAPSTDSPVSEDQLVTEEGNKDTEATSRARTAGRASDESATRRFAFAESSGARSHPSISPNPNGFSELQNPATVFVANPTSNPALNLGSEFRAARSFDLQLPSGTEIIAHTTNVISSGLESPVIAVVDRSVQLGNSVVI